MGPLDAPTDRLISVVKVVFNSMASSFRPSPRSFARVLSLIGLLALAASGLPQRADAEVYFDVRALLSGHFQRSERVTFVRVQPTSTERAAIEQRTGRPLARAAYNVFVAQTGGRVDGYAVVDEETGQHEPIRFAVFFDASGQVTRHEIVEYREAYGGEVRQDRFRRQFVGRGPASSYRLGDEIDSVSGATISARAMCAGVQRAAMLVEIARRRPTVAPAAARTASR